MTRIFVQSLSTVMTVAGLFVSASASGVEARIGYALVSGLFMIAAALTLHNGGKAQP